MYYMGTFRRLCDRNTVTVSNSRATAWCVTASKVGTLSSNVEIPSAICNVPVCKSALLALAARGGKSHRVARDG